MWWGWSDVLVDCVRGVRGRKWLLWWVSWGNYFNKYSMRLYWIWVWWWMWECRCSYTNGGGKLYWIHSFLLVHFLHSLLSALSTSHDHSPLHWLRSVLLIVSTFCTPHTLIEDWHTCPHDPHRSIKHQHMCSHDCLSLVHFFTFAWRTKLSPSLLSKALLLPLAPPTLLFHISNFIC